MLIYIYQCRQVWPPEPKDSADINLRVTDHPLRIGQRFWRHLCRYEVKARHWCSSELDSSAERERADRGEVRA